MSSLPKPAYPAPSSSPREWTLTDLQDHLQTAVLLELHTIPLYLFSMYAIPASTDEIAANARNLIKGVVKEEMLHLALAGNLLCAIGGKPRIYGSDYTPVYPCQLFYHPIDLNLLPPNKPARETFIKVEAPVFGPPRPEKHLLPEYKSIGEFYESLIAGLQYLNSTISGLFRPDRTNQQFGPKDHIYGPDLIPVTDLATARSALNLIILQGEGSTVGPLSPGSHWQKFIELAKIDDFEKYYHGVVENPKTSDFKGNIKKTMLASDAAYSFLLLTIERCWAFEEHRGDIVKNIHPLMGHVLDPIASFLVTQRLDGRSEYAAPPFNYYRFRSTEPEVAVKELRATIKEAWDSYPNNEALHGAFDAANGLWPKA